MKNYETLPCFKFLAALYVSLLKPPFGVKESGCQPSSGEQNGSPLDRVEAVASGFRAE
jgi:hypothetical protein